jgi:hypothetical protein
MSGIRFSIDGREVEVEAGRTILDGAHRLGLDIPTLCHVEACGPMNSCQVCVVRVRVGGGAARVVPSCGTRVVEGMEVESETAEVHGLRRTALELLLSDHVGDCLAPCHRICPLELNIPRMIRQVGQGLKDEAIETVHQALPLASVLSRLCHAPCENGCRRESCDGAATIRELERYVTEENRGRRLSWVPGVKPATGNRVAVVGAGPAGLAAADYLQRQGHACVVLDRNERAGGTLRGVVELPVELMDFEVSQLERMGVEFRMGVELGKGFQLIELEQEYDAVVVAVGKLREGEAEGMGMMSSPTGLRVNGATGQAGAEKVFAAGSAVRPLKQLVRVLAEGRGVAECVHQFLVGLPMRSTTRTFSSMMGRLDEVELQQFMRTASSTPKGEASVGAGRSFNDEEARVQAGRCLHCDCRAAGHCGLQSYARMYGANPNRFSRQRRRFTQVERPGGVVFESGKCILCGICVEVARRAGESLGLTFVGRGFDVQVAAPFGRDFSEGIQKVAGECVALCPTGAIAYADGKVPGGDAAVERECS